MAPTAPDGGWTAERFLHELVVPRRHREARVADALVGSPPTFVDTRWGQVAAWRRCVGPATLLVHGFEDDHSLWSPLIDALVLAGWPFIALDLPAHGASGGTWSMGWEATDAIRDVVEVLGPVDSVVVHSFGCGAAVGAMLEGVDVSRAAFVAPPLQSTNQWRRYADRLGVDTDVADEASRIYYEAVGAHRGAWNVRSAYPALDVDILIIHSRDDERAPFPDAEEVVRLCRRSRLFDVTGLGHRRTARDPAVVAEITAFVTTLERRDER
jgi:pimeloyl-ACP methyl ester carboxylesterase